MYSLSVRLNSVFFYFGVCTAILCGFNVATTIFLKKTSLVTKFSYTPKFVYNNRYTRIQHSNGVMEMDIDFSPCFNWNSNLVFAWITATYESTSKKGKTNKVSVTVWDNIMKRDKPETHHVVYSEKDIEYPLVDANFDLAGKNVTLELHWEHMPVVGPILKKKVYLENVILPKEVSAKVPKIIEQSEVEYEDRALRRRLIN